MSGVRGLLLQANDTVMSSETTTVEELRAAHDLQSPNDNAAVNEMNPEEASTPNAEHQIEIIIPESAITEPVATDVNEENVNEAKTAEAHVDSVDSEACSESESKSDCQVNDDNVGVDTTVAVTETPEPIEAQERPRRKRRPLAETDMEPVLNAEADPEPVMMEASVEPTTENASENEAAVGTVAAAQTVVVRTSAPEPTETKPAGDQPSVAETASSQIDGAHDDTGNAEPTFRDLELHAKVVDAVEASGYKHPTKIQARIIPHMLQGRDVLAQSQTGSGKTAAFALPVLSQLDPATRAPQILVLTPTRELAIQVAKAFSTYGASLPDFRVAAIYGGQDYEPQLKQIRRGVHVVVGTPGRVIDHIKRDTLKLDTLKCLVLDEADEMLNMGFLEDVEFVLQQTPPERQVALFSATLPDAIRKISQRYLNDPAKITIKQKTATADSIRQRALFVAPRLKMEVLKRFLEVEDTDGVIVFTKTKDATITVAEKLGHAGFSSIALNGDMPQSVRERAIQNLKSGKIDILVATDVAARGLDVQRISHVVNFDLPHDSESYVHRIGRTGRAGRKGEAVLLLSNGQRGKMKMIERATKQKIEVVDPPSTETLNLRRIERFKMDIAKTVADKDLSVFEELVRDCGEDSGIPMEKIAAALAHLAQKGRPFLAKELPEAGPRDRDDRGSRDRDDRGRRERFDNRDGDGGRPMKKLGPPRPGMTRYRLDVGRKDRVKVGNIVGAIANEGNIDGEFIGPLRIFDTFSIVDLPEGMPNDVYQTLSRTRVAGKPLRLQVDDGGPNRGEIAARGGRHNKPHGKPHGKFNGPRGKFSGPKGGKFKKGKKKG